MLIFEDSKSLSDYLFFGWLFSFSLFFMPLPTFWADRAQMDEKVPLKTPVFPNIEFLYFLNSKKLRKFWKFFSPIISQLSFLVSYQEFEEYLGKFVADFINSSVRILSVVENRILWLTHIATLSPQPFLFCWHKFLHMNKGLCF